MKIKCYGNISNRGVGRPETYLEKFGRDVFVHWIVFGEFKGDAEPGEHSAQPTGARNGGTSHIKTVERHPGRSIGLAKRSTSW